MCGEREVESKKKVPGPVQSVGSQKKKKKKQKKTLTCVHGGTSTYIPNYSTAVCVWKGSGNNLRGKKEERKKEEAIVHAAIWGGKRSTQREEEDTAVLLCVFYGSQPVEYTYMQLAGGDK